MSTGINMATKKLTTHDHQYSYVRIRSSVLFGVSAANLLEKVVNYENFNKATRVA